jgi:Ca2+/H+ antiporter, TMEM165/GDT1 family
MIITTKKRWFFMAPPIVLAALAIFSFITMLLWNALLPVIFHLPLITFWQAAGLLILARLLFGGHHWNRGGHHAHWRNRISDKWEKMTPEEREQFRQKWPFHRQAWDRCHTDQTGQEKKDIQSV